MNIDKKYILLAVLLSSLIFFEYFAPKEADWSYSFSKDDKIPFGNYIFYDLLQDIFPDSKILNNKKSLYNNKNYNTLSNYSYIISTEDFKIDKTNKEILLKMAAKGNNIFISAMSFEKSLCDTLKFNTKSEYNNTFKEDSIFLFFTDKKLNSQNNYKVEKSIVNYYFSELDSSKTKILGTFDTENANFIKIPFGKGNFYLHSQPLAFTNYNILTANNVEYVFKALSYLNSDYIIWDEFYKPNNSVSNSPLAYILKQDALRNAYYLILILVVLFFFFNGKRKQRPIPIIEPLTNSSLEFAETLGNLYLNKKNHKDILLKRYLYWTDFLREKYFIPITKIKKENINLIAEKTGIDVSFIKKIINLYEIAKQQQYISSNQLLSFNKVIEQFYKKSR